MIRQYFSNNADTDVLCTIMLIMILFSWIFSGSVTTWQFSCTNNEKPTPFFINDCLNGAVQWRCEPRYDGPTVFIFSISGYAYAYASRDEKCQYQSTRARNDQPVRVEPQKHTGTNGGIYETNCAHARIVNEAIKWGIPFGILQILIIMITTIILIILIVVARFFFFGWWCRCWLTEIQNTGALSSRSRGRCAECPAAWGFLFISSSIQRSEISLALI
jgi:hypothetical protein